MEEKSSEPKEGEGEGIGVLDALAACSLHEQGIALWFLDAARLMEQGFSPSATMTVVLHEGRFLLWNMTRELPAALVQQLALGHSIDPQEPEKKPEYAG